MGEKHAPKPPHIANFFVQIGRAEHLGTGIRNIYKYAPICTGVAPIIEDEDVYTVKIGAFKENKQNMLSNVATISNEAGARSGARNDARNVPLKDNIELTDRQTVILSVLRDNVSLNVPLNTTILSQKLKVARKTMQRELSEL